MGYVRVVESVVENESVSCDAGIADSDADAMLEVLCEPNLGIGNQIEILEQLEVPRKIRRCTRGHLDVVALQRSLRLGLEEVGEEDSNLRVSGQFQKTERIAIATTCVSSSKFPHWTSSINSPSPHSSHLSHLQPT